MVMRDRSLWTFALTAVVFMTAAVATAQDPEAETPPPVKKEAPPGKAPATTVPGTGTPGLGAPGVEAQGVPTPPPPKAEAVKQGEPAKQGEPVKQGEVEEVAVPVPAAVTTDAAAPRYARVLGKEVRILCFASQRSPTFEDVLREGDVVMVGEETGEFVKVVMPLGVVGYVHRDFTTPPVNGVISTTRPRVSFRYRPKAGEAPTQLLEKGTPLRYLGTEESWWKVRMVPEAAWLPIKEVQVFAEASPTLVKSHDALRQLHAEQCAQAAAAFAKADAETKLQEAQVLKLQELRTEVKEAADLLDEDQLQKLSELEKSVEELQKELKQESPAAISADLLAAHVKSQRLTVSARLLLKEQPKPAHDVAPGPRLAGTVPFTRFAVTGWLRFERDAAGHRRCRLEKGKKAIAYITCTSGRYDLHLFDGIEVGVRGSRTSGVELIAPVIDAVRLEVLSVSPD